ncbi:MAG: CrcB family protein, partial [Thermodesulfobacteriota bacterium]
TGRIFWLSVAGALGARARYGLSAAVQRLAGSGWPWGTLVVNAAGCLAAGLLWALFETRLLLPGHTRLVVMVGFLGAFTTFSAYVVETGTMLRAGSWLSAALYIVAQNSLGLATFFLGQSLGRHL